MQGLSETLAQARIELSQETESRKGVEAKADELAAMRRALEAELAQRAEAEVQWRQERMEVGRATKRRRRHWPTNSLAAEQGKLAETNERCRTLEQRVQGLSETLAQTRIELSQETESRKGVEAKADELAAVRRALEAELAQRAEAEAQWQQERVEVQSAPRNAGAGMADKTQAWQPSRRSWPRRTNTAARSSNACRG